MTDDPNSTPRLPLVAFEHYMLADDRPDYPMVFYIRLTLDGVLEREPFERAVHRTVAMHPLLQAKLELGKGRHRHWIWDKPMGPAIDWEGSNPAASAYIDLTHEVGLRLKFNREGQQSVLLMGFHHSCSDGLGAVKFTEDLLAAYAVEYSLASETAKDPAGRRLPGDHPPINNEAAPPAPALLKRLAERGRFGLRWPGLLLRAPLELLGALSAIEFFSHRPVPLDGSAQPGAATDAWPAECWHEFDTAQLQRLKAAATREGGTLNDLLVRDMFLAAGDWIDQHSPKKHGKHARVMVPVNLRTRHDGDLPAANVVAMINIDRRPHRWRNLRRMLRVIHWEISVVRRGRFGLTFIRGIQLVHYGFNKMASLMPTSRCMATCVLSNLGELWRHSRLATSTGEIVAGNVALRRFDPLPPIRPFTRAALGVITYNKRLTIALNYDRHTLTPAEGEQLLATFIRRLEASAADGSSVPLALPVSGQLRTGEASDTQAVAHRQ